MLAGGPVRLFVAPLSTAVDSHPHQCCFSFRSSSRKPSGCLPDGGAGSGGPLRLAVGRRAPGVEGSTCRALRPGAATLIYKCRGGAPRGVRPTSLGAERLAQVFRCTAIRAPRCGDPHRRLSALPPPAFSPRAFGARRKTHAGFTAERPLRRKTAASRRSFASRVV